MHGKVLFWKSGFLEEEAQNFLFGARSVLTFEDDHIKFWCGIILPNVCGPLRPLFGYGIHWDEVDCDIIVCMLSELKYFSFVYRFKDFE